MTGTTLPSLPDGFNYVTEGGHPCRIVIRDLNTNICRTEHGHPVEAAERAIRNLQEALDYAKA